MQCTLDSVRVMRCHAELGTLTELLHFAHRYSRYRLEHARARVCVCGTPYVKNRQETAIAQVSTMQFDSIRVM